MPLLEKLSWDLYFHFHILVPFTLFLSLAFGLCLRPIVTLLLHRGNSYLERPLVIIRPARLRRPWPHTIIIRGPLARLSLCLLENLGHPADSGPVGYLELLHSVSPRGSAYVSDATHRVRLIDTSLPKGRIPPLIGTNLSERRRSWTTLKAFLQVWTTSTDHAMIVRCRRSAVRIF